MKFIDRFRDRKVCLISHNDLDGIGSIVIYKSYVEPITSYSEIYSFGYDDILDIEKNTSSFENFDLIIFIDIAPTIELYIIFKNLGIDIYIFDHHVSAYRELFNIADEDKYFYSLDKCGTQIFFDEITKGRRLSKCAFQFVEYISTYDLWQDKSVLWEKGKALHNILWGSIDRTVQGVNQHSRFITTQLDKIKKGKSFYFTEYENKLSILAEETETKYFNSCKKKLSIRKDNSGNTYAYFEAPSKISLIANRILKEFNNLDYICGHSTFNDSNGVFIPSISLRSAGEIDVSVIASDWGSGGHKFASGISFKNYDDFINFREGKLHLI